MKPRGDRITSLVAMRRQELQLRRGLHAALREYLLIIARAGEHHAFTADASIHFDVTKIDQAGHWPALLDKHVTPVLAEILTKIGPPKSMNLSAGVTTQITHWRAAWLRRRTQQLADVPDTITRQIRDEIAADVETNGPDPRKAAAIIRSLLDPNAATWASRASTIARTEVVSANNQGGLAAWQAVHAGLQSTGGGVMKTWLATEDTATRPDHQEIDGTEVGIDETFSVGGDEMSGPGDESADPGNTINCRCTLTYRVVDANGDDTDVGADDSTGDTLTAAATTEAPVTAPAETAPAETDSTDPQPYEPQPYEADDSETRQCPSCSLMNAPDAIYCDQCGVKFADDPPESYSRSDSETVQCPQDESYNEPDARFCDQCGYQLAGSTDVVVASAEVPTAGDTPLAPDGTPTGSVPAGNFPEGTQWAGPLVPVDTIAPDRRLMAAAGCTVRPLPLPLSFQLESSHGGEEAGTTVIVGRILGTSIDGGNLLAYGDFLDPGDNFALADLIQAAAQRVQSGLGMVSIDGAPLVVEYGAAQPDGSIVSVDPGLYDGDMDAIVEVYSEWELMGATLVADPAFGTARIAYVDGAALPGVAPSGGIGMPEPVTPAGDVLIDSVTAAADNVLQFPGLAAEHIYPAEWFEPVALDGPTRLTITDEGRVFGHVAQNGTCHIGFADECVTPPSSASGYAYFHVGEVKTTAGMLPIGKLTVGGGHADIHANWRAAVDHYDNAGTAVAVVRAHEDEHGIQVTGALIPEASGNQIAALRRNHLSGDWRPIGGHREMVAALSVNTGGFPLTPRAALAADGSPTALVAAGIVYGEPVDDEPESTGEVTLPSGARLSPVDVAVLASAFAKASSEQQTRDREAGELRARFMTAQRDAVIARLEASGL